MTEVLVSPEYAQPGDLIGHTKSGRPIRLAAGGREPVVVDDGDDDPDVFDARDDSDDDNGDDNGDDDDSGDDSDDDSDEPDLKQQLEAAQAELAKLRRGNQRNNAELRKRRVFAKWMADHGIDDLDEWLAKIGVTTDGKPVDPATPENPTSGASTQPAPPGPPIDEIKQLVQKQLEIMADQHVAQTERYETALRVSAIRGELLGLGLDQTKLEMAMRVVDLDSVGVNRDGIVDGAAEAAASLKKEIPEWFRALSATGGRPTRRGGQDVDGAGKPPRQPAARSWEERAMGRLLGGK